MSVYAYGEAARLLEQAASVQEVLDPRDSGRLCDLLLALSEALLAADEPERVVEDVAERAYTLATAASDEERAGTACQQAIDGLFTGGNQVAIGGPRGQEWAGRAESLAREGTMLRAWVDVTNSMAWREGNLQPDAAELAERALDTARTTGDIDAIRWAAYAALVGFAQPRFDADERGLRLAEELAALPPGGGRTRLVSRSLHTVGLTFLSWGRRSQAEDVWTIVAELADRTTDAYAVADAAACRVDIATLDGQLGDALEVAETMSRSETGAGEQSIALVRPSVYSGQLVALETMESLFARSGGGELRGPVVPLLLAHAGRSDEARDALRTDDLALPPAPGGPELYEATHFLTPLLEAATMLGEPDAARALLARLDRAMVPLTLVFHTVIDRHRGAAAVLLEEPEQALEYYRRGLQAAEQVRFRPEVALIRLGLAELLLDHYPDQREQALGHLDFAIAEFQVMQMQPSLERALSRREILKA
jgi:tetratricopeptide (TPR) repeat protein